MCLWPFSGKYTFFSFLYRVLNPKHALPLKNTTNIGYTTKNSGFVYVANRDFFTVSWFVSKPQWSVGVCVEEPNFICVTRLYSDTIIWDAERCWICLCLSIKSLLSLAASGFCRLFWALFGWCECRDVQVKGRVNIVHCGMWTQIGV